MMKNDELMNMKRKRKWKWKQKWWKYKYSMKMKKKIETIIVNATKAYQTSKEDVNMVQWEKKDLKNDPPKNMWPRTYLIHVWDLQVYKILDLKSVLNKRVLNSSHILLYCTSSIHIVTSSLHSLMDPADSLLLVVVRLVDRLFAWYSIIH